MLNYFTVAKASVEASKKAQIEEEELEKGLGKRTKRDSLEMPSDVALSPSSLEDQDFRSPPRTKRPRTSEGPARPMTRSAAKNNKEKEKETKGNETETVLPDNQEDEDVFVVSEKRTPSPKASSPVVPSPSMTTTERSGSTRSLRQRTIDGRSTEKTTPLTSKKTKPPSPVPTTPTTTGTSAKKRKDTSKGQQKITKTETPSKQTKIATTTGSSSTQITAAPAPPPPPVKKVVTPINEDLLHPFFRKRQKCADGASEESSNSGFESGGDDEQPTSVLLNPITHCKQTPLDSSDPEWAIWTLLYPPSSSPPSVSLPFSVVSVECLDQRARESASSVVFGRPFSILNLKRLAQIGDRGTDSFFVSDSSLSSSPLIVPDVITETNMDEEFSETTAKSIISMILESCTSCVAPEWRDRLQKHIQPEQVRAFVEMTQRRAQNLSRTKGKELWSERHRVKNLDMMVGNSLDLHSLSSWLQAIQTNSSSSSSSSSSSASSSQETATKQSKSSSSSKTGLNPLMAMMKSASAGAPKQSLVYSAVINGECGTGKTACVYAIAKQYELQVLEINTSFHRDGPSLLRSFQEATQSRHLSTVQVKRSESSPLGDVSSPPSSSSQPEILLSPPTSQETPEYSMSEGTQPTILSQEALSPKGTFGESGEQLTGSSSSVSISNSRNKIILLDDVDVAFRDDKKFHQAVKQLIQSTRQPIVMTCSFLPPYLDSIDATLLMRVDLERPFALLHANKHFSVFLEDLEQVTEMLKAVCSVIIVETGTSFFSDPQFVRMVHELCAVYRFDFRRIVNQLQFWLQHHQASSQGSTLPSSFVLGLSSDVPVDKDRRIQRLIENMERASESGLQLEAVYHYLEGSCGDEDETGKSLMRTNVQMTIDRSAAVINEMMVDHKKKQESNLILLGQAFATELSVLMEPQRSMRMVDQEKQKKNFIDQNKVQRKKAAERLHNDLSNKLDLIPSRVPPSSSSSSSQSQEKRNDSWLHKVRKMNQMVCEVDLLERFEEERIGANGCQVSGLSSELVDEDSVVNESPETDPTISHEVASWILATGLEEYVPVPQSTTTVALEPLQIQRSVNEVTALSQQICNRFGNGTFMMGLERRLDYVQYLAGLYESEDNREILESKRRFLHHLSEIEMSPVEQLFLREQTIYSTTRRWL